MLLLGKSEKRLMKLDAELQTAGYEQYQLHSLDYGKAAWADFEALTGALSEQGPCAGLIHCSADYDGLKPFESIRPDEWLSQIHNNLNGPYALTRAMLPLIQQSEHGKILFLTNRANRSSCAYEGAYGVAQAGLTQLAKMLSEEMQQAGKITVSSYDPGPMHTGLRELSHPGESWDSRHSPELVAEKISDWLLKDIELS